MISIDATKNSLKVCMTELLISGSVHIYTVKFKFNSDWDGLVKTAVFKAGSTSVSVLLDQTGECDIPWEVLVKPRYILEVGVYGTKGDTIVLPTIWGRLGTVQEGAQPGDNAQKPTPSVYQQLITQLDAGRSAAQAAAIRAQADADSAAQIAVEMSEIAAQVAQNAATAETAQRGAETARDAAESYAPHPPVIGEDGLWYLWDGTQYTATDKSSSGLPGVVSMAGAELSLMLENNMEYRVNDPVTSLEITGFVPGPAGKAELWGIVFTAGGTITVTVPDTVVWAVAEPVFTPGSTYWIIWTPLGDKYLAVWTELEAADEPASI